MNKIIIMALIAILLPITMTTTITQVTIKAQETETESILPKTFDECWGLVNGGLLIRGALNMESLIREGVDIEDPAIERAAKNVCKFYHEKFGDWQGKDIVGVNGFRNSEFLDKYYPNGLPEAVEQLLTPLG